MGGDARLGVYLSPSTNYERRILEDAFDRCVLRPSPRATSRSIPETVVAYEEKKTLILRLRRVRMCQARRMAQGRG